MIDKIKSSRLIVGIALIVQSFAFVVHSLIAANKRRGEAGALFAFAIIFSAIGAYLVALEKLEDRQLYGDMDHSFNGFDELDYDDDDDEGKISIPIDEEANEGEFDQK